MRIEGLEVASRFVGLSVEREGFFKGLRRIVDLGAFKTYENTSKPIHITFNLAQLMSAQRTKTP